MELNEDTHLPTGEGESHHSATSPPVPPTTEELECDILPTSYTPAKYDHTQGFGSFDFTQSEDFKKFEWRTGGGYKGKHPRNQFYRAARLKRKKEDKEPFPFFRLAPEIRNHIYLILLSSIQRPNTDVLEPKSVPQGIRFVLSSETWDPEIENEEECTVISRYPIGAPENDPNYYLDIYKKMVDGTITVGECPSGFLATPYVAHHFPLETGLPTLNYDSDSSIEEFESRRGKLERPAFGYKLGIRRKNARRDAKTSKCPQHPFADTNDKAPCDCVLEEMLGDEFVRCLSHVSHQFSSEVGAVIWQNSVLEVEELDALPVFAKFHPKVLPLIRGLVLPLSYEEGFLDTKTSELVGVCDFINRHLMLKFLSLKFRCFGDCLIDIYEERKHLSWAAEFKKLKLARQLHIEIIAENNLQMALPHSTPDQLELLWMPDCLREERNEEEEDYLSCRKYCFETRNERPRRGLATRMLKHLSKHRYRRWGR